MTEGFRSRVPKALRASQPRVKGMYVRYLRILDRIGAVNADKRGRRAFPPGAESMTMLFAGKVCSMNGSGAVLRARLARSSLAISVICTVPPFEKVWRCNVRGLVVVSRFVISCESRYSMAGCTEACFFSALDQKKSTKSHVSQDLKTERRTHCCGS